MITKHKLWLQLPLSTFVSNFSYQPYFVSFLFEFVCSSFKSFIFHNMRII